VTIGLFSNTESQLCAIDNTIHIAVGSGCNSCKFNLPFSLRQPVFYIFRTACTTCRDSIIKCTEGCSNLLLPISSILQALQKMSIKPIACIFKRKRICSFTIDLNVAIFRNRYANIWHSVHCFTKSYREFIECTAITRTTSIISDKICLLKSFGNIYICQVILFK